MPSWQAVATNAGLGLIPERAISHVFAHPPRFRGPLVPGWVRRRYAVVEHQIGAGTMATIGPRWPSPGRHLMLLHGGAYTLQGRHWRIVRDLVERGHCTVTYVDYPLAPEHSVHETVPMVEACWEHLVATNPGDGINLIGDSAGGGLALVLAQRLRDTGGQPPQRTVLLSPWVECTLADEETLASASRDRLLPRAGLLAAAGLYAGGTDLADPLLSPINAGLQDLGEVLAFVSSEEIFLPQCRRLASLASAAGGTSLELREYAGVPHDWALFGLPEARRMLDEVSEFLWGPTGARES